MQIIVKGTAMPCPQCGHTEWTEGVPVCEGMPPGIDVPQIHKCKSCTRTFSTGSIEMGGSSNYNGNYHDPDEKYTRIVR